MNSKTDLLRKRKKKKGNEFIFSDENKFVPFFCSTTELLWQGERLIAENADDRYHTYIYEPGSFRPLAMLDGEGPIKATLYYYQLDHLGTPQELTDYIGEIMWSAKYRAYGNLAALDVAEIDNPLRFQGQYLSLSKGDRFIFTRENKSAPFLHSSPFCIHPTMK